MILKKPSQRSFDVILKIKDRVLGGQQNCFLQRSSKVINITNKINANWESYLAGNKSWNLVCDGLFIKDIEAFKILEESFKKGEPVEVSLINADSVYSGEGLIINFPISTKYNDSFTYNLKIQGIGELK